MEALVELVRFIGVAICIYVFFYAASRFPATFTLKQDVVKQETREPVDSAWMDDFTKEQKRRS